MGSVHVYEKHDKPMQGRYDGFLIHDKNLRGYPRQTYDEIVVKLQRMLQSDQEAREWWQAQLARQPARRGGLSFISPVPGRYC